MTKEAYKDKLRRHGYRFEGNIAYLDTPYGTWVQELVPVSGRNWALKTLSFLDENREGATGA